MQINIKRALINFLWAYLLVTVLAYALSWAAGVIFNLPSYIDLGVTMFEDPAFKMTVPYHLLINFIIWVLFSYIYFRKKTGRPQVIREAVHLGIFWLIIAMIVDFVGFVLIESPVSLTVHEFYVGYQPWISITYLIVVLSPLVGWRLARRNAGTLASTGS